MGRQTIEDALRSLERYCRTQNYAGYCKFDALNSPILERWAGPTAIGRLVVTQAVNRVPFGLRALFKVEKKRNPKGVANFVRAYAAMASTPAFPQQKEARERARDLSDWLLANHSAALGAYSGPGLAWGYHFPWQSPGFFASRHSPNCIVTVFCGEALLDAFVLTGHPSYLEGAKGAREYLLRSLPVLESTDAELCIGYVERGLRWKVININAVAAGFLARLAKVSEDVEAMDSARRMVNWVMKAQDPAGPFWNYTSPRSQSGIGPDNYHTGGILDGILDYMDASGDRTLQVPWLSALEFYRNKFFTPEGAARWRVGRLYPIDIHGAAQGIITFTKASVIEPTALELARKVAGWTVKEMQDPESGRFYYQKHRLFTWKLDLMRWNNSWMMRALADLMERERRGTE